MGAVSWGTPGSNFESWLNAGGWYVVALLFIGVLLSISISLIGFSRRRQEESRMGTSLGRTLSMGGAFLTLIGATLPWTSGSYGVIANGLGGILVYAFGLFWFVFFPVPRKIHAILGAGWGGLALLFALEAIGSFAALGITLEYGAYVSILGSILLTGGSALSFMKAVKGEPQRERDEDVFGNIENS